MSLLSTLTCALWLWSWNADCAINEQPELTEKEDTFVSSIKPVESEPIVEEKLIVPHRISTKISPAAWDRAMGLRPLLIEVVENEFDGDMVWLGVMVALCHTESRCDEKAVSWVGAASRWQWMKSSAKAFSATDCRNLPRNKNYKDARYDPIWSTYCAARHLKQNLRIVH